MKKIKLLLLLPLFLLSCVDNSSTFPENADGVFYGRLTVGSYTQDNVGISVTVVSDSTVDVFFNDAISKNTRRNLYSKHEDINYTFSDKLRVGVAINNEFKFGMLTTIFDWGVYLYNPSRNYYHDYVRDYCQDGLKKRPLFYKSSGPGNEEAFHYFRFGVKFQVWDNIYLQATCKTHMQIAEFVEFGINYQIPFLSKERRKDGESIVFHQRKGWWEN